MTMPAVILVRTQLAQNMGATARAMLNFGLTDLRLVAPEVSHLSQDARSLAAGADSVLENAKVFQTTQEAVADLHRVYATTVRHRDMISLQFTPRQAARHAFDHQAQGHQVGILFGPEKAGLVNDDVALADAIITVPVNSDFSSLNLAQAVLLVAYEWSQASLAEGSTQGVLLTGEMPLATKEDLHGFLGQLEEALDRSGYFRAAHKKPKMLRTLHATFSRIPMTFQEIRTLRGVISDLVNPEGIYSTRVPKKDRGE